MNEQDPRVKELLDLAREEGITLPLPPLIIIKMEGAGAVVNLRTGAIEIGAENARYMPTNSAQAAYSVVPTDRGAYVLERDTGLAYEVKQTANDGRADWRKQRMRTLVRDGFRCQVEGCTEHNLNRLTVHHKTPRSEGGTDDLDNLIIICEYHHRALHRPAGHRGQHG